MLLRRLDIACCVTPNDRINDSLTMAFFEVKIAGFETTGDVVTITGLTIGNENLMQMTEI